MPSFRRCRPINTRFKLFRQGTVMGDRPPQRVAAYFRRLRSRSLEKFCSNCDAGFRSTDFSTGCTAYQAANLPLELQTRHSSPQMGIRRQCTSALRAVPPVPSNLTPERGEYDLQKLCGVPAATVGAVCSPTDKQISSIDRMAGLRSRRADVAHIISKRLNFRPWCKIGN